MTDSIQRGPKTPPRKVTPTGSSRRATFRPSLTYGWWSELKTRRRSPDQNAGLLESTSAGNVIGSPGRRTAFGTATAASCAPAVAPAPRARRIDRETALTMTSAQAPVRLDNERGAEVQP